MFSTQGSVGWRPPCGTLSTLNAQGRAEASLLIFRNRAYSRTFPLQKDFASALFVRLLFVCLHRVRNYVPMRS